MPEKPHLCAAGSMPPSPCELMFSCVCSCSDKSTLNLFTDLEFSRVSCPFKSHVFSSTSSRAKIRSKCPPAKPWARGRGRVSYQSHIFHWLSYINLLSSAQYSTSYQMKKLILTLNFTKLSYDLEYCYDCFIFVFLIFGALDFIIKKRIINVIRKNGDWFYSLEWIIPVIECFFI